LWHSGWSDGSLGALAAAWANNWDEGVYNFVGTDGEIQADINGDFSVDFTIDGTGNAGSALPMGTTYNNVKFIVKEIQGVSTPPPGPGDYGTTWQPMLMEIRTLNFAIP